MDSIEPPDDSVKALTEIRKKMLNELENQLESQGYYNTWGIIRLVLLQRLKATGEKLLISQNVFQRWE